MDCLETSCNNKKYLCFVRGCIMRDKTEMKEYMNKYRFCKILERMKSQQVKCDFCDKVLETLHHKDENHSNNRLSNLQPTCQEHHLGIPHQSDMYTPDMPNFVNLRPKNTVILQKTIYIMCFKTVTLVEFTT